MQRAAHAAHGDDVATNAHAIANIGIAQPPPPHSTFLSLP